MDTRPYENQPVTIQVQSAELRVVPGSSVNVPLSLYNQSQVDGFFELTVGGVPSNWVSVPSSTIRLAARERREVLLAIQPPPPPVGRAGRHEVAIRLASQETPQQVAETTCTLTVAELEVPGPIGILLAATEYSVAPGKSVAIPIVLFNQGLESDIVSLSVEGIPSSWVSASSASTMLIPGQQQEVTLTIRPTPSGESGAGRHPFKIHAVSQANPGRVSVAECALGITSFSQFSSELRPQRIDAGSPANVVVENQGNVETVFSLTWQSPDGALDFEPSAKQQVNVPAGEVVMAEFRATPRSRPLLGKERILPFSTHVQATGGGARNLTGEVVGKALIPTWLLGALLVALLACLCLSVLGAGLGGLLDQAPSEAPAATTSPGEEQPAEPPPEQPVEPPPEQPPAEQPPEEQPPEEEPSGTLLGRHRVAQQPAGHGETAGSGASLTSFRVRASLQHAG